MSFFSNLDTAIQEQAAGRGREPVAVGAVGVCLEDSGQPVELYKVSDVWSGGQWLTVQHLSTGTERTLQPAEFWVLLPAL